MKKKNQNLNEHKKRIYGVSLNPNGSQKSKSCLGIFIRAILTVFFSVLIILTVVKAGSLDPSASPASTMKSLQDVYNSITGTFDSSSISASSTGSLIQNLKYIVNNIFWAGSGNDIYNTNSANVGIGTTTPASLLTIGSSGNGLQINSSGQLISGTWQGTVIGSQYGGTGQNTSDWSGLLTISSGTFSTTTDSTSNWDTAYGWGDHSSGGYLQNLVEDTSPQLGGNLDLNSKWISGDGGSEGIYIDSSGKVGIGTENPGAQIHSAKSGGSSRFYLDAYDSGAGYPEVRLRKSDTDTLGIKTTTDNNDYLGVVSFYGVHAGSSFNKGAQIQAVQDGDSGVTHVPTNLILYTHSSSGANSNQLVLHNDGRIGVGTDNPGAKAEVEVVNNSNIAGLLIDQNDTTNNPYGLEIQNAGTGNSIYDDSGARLTAAGVWADASDVSRKRDIFDLGYGLEELMQLRPVSYTWEATNERDIGFVAQEIKDILPELVHGQDGDLSLAYGHFAPLLTKAIQEQQEEIEELKEITGQSSENNFLESRQSTDLNEDSGFLSNLRNLVKSVFQELGLFIENGIAELKEIFVERLTVKEIQLSDKATGEIYCTWIENGEWIKTKGECHDMNKTEPQLSDGSTDNEPSPEAEPPDTSNEVTATSSSSFVTEDEKDNLTEEEVDEEPAIGEPSIEEESVTEESVTEESTTEEPVVEEPSLSEVPAEQSLDEEQPPEQPVEELIEEQLPVEELSNEEQIFE